MAKRPVKKASEKHVEEQNVETPRKANNQARPPKNAPMQKKKHHKLTRAEYDDLRQIEWVPFDPYAD